MSSNLYDFDLAELETYLNDNITGFGTLTSMDKFSDGQSNPTYKLQTANKAYVLRAKPPGKLLGSAHQVDREYRVMNALAASNVPVPQMHHLSTNDNPLGVMFLVMEFIDGRIFWDPALPNATNADRTAIFNQMNNTLAALHSVNIEAAGLADYGKPGNYFVRQTGRWIKQYHASELVANPQIDRIIDWLNDHMVEDDGQISLVHGDFRIDNMVFNTDHPQLLAVLDWELSTLGHGLADLSYQCMQWRLPASAALGGLGGLDRAELGIPSEQDYIGQYLDKCSLPPIDNWDFYLIFSIFRLIAIVQGVIKRSQDGNASDPKSTNRMQKVSTHLTEMAIGLIK
ncbi:MAG: phosphotransferase family protein [Hyphomicrobiales bacterium]|nr:MAG: phosphotransferase family protein [Hyphomicrobiales bacterium]